MVRYWGNDKLKTTLKKCGELFLSFAKVGVLTFGGGLAMLPMLQREIVERQIGRAHV